MGNNSEFNDDLKAVLDQATQLVTKDRAEAHGNAYEQHALAAKFWNVFLSGRNKLASPIYPHEVAQMMLLLKVSRNVIGAFNPDTFVDQAGYAALSYVLQKEHRNGN